ncbi:Lrp/AsnC family transcriptional regulator [Candidatus Woesearchaeota archaeon]|nr:Lrp/AsnC family transcriptional regulator [Candidatus Woesearchaeota archaeon]
MKYLPENIDKIDQKILITLDIDARMPLSRLAKICKISRDKANYRINRLLQKNILGGFYTLIDVESLGYANYVVFLKIKNKETEIISYLKENSHVNWLVNAEMQWNIVTWIAAKDQFTFIKFWKEFAERFENSLINAEIAILGSLVHYKRHFFTNEKNEDEIVVFGGRERKEIDDKDMEILRAISFDARIKLLDLAKKVNLNFKTLQKRMRMLEKEQIIIGYRTYLNYSEIGYNYYLILLRLSNINKEILNKIRSYAKLDPYIDVSWQLIGKANMAIHIKAKNDKHLREVFNNFKDRFQDFIIDYETLLLYKQHKFVSFPS